MADKDCPRANGGCLEGFCEQGVCKTRIPSQSTSPLSQLYGDCKVTKCSQEGNSYVDNDDGDFYDDGNPCTEDKCNKGSPFTVARLGMLCGTGNMICGSTGQCVDCIDDKGCGDGKKCTRGKCVFESCSNNKLDPNETSLDCGGGDCNPCEDGSACNGDLDCVSNNCAKDKDNKKTCSSTCTDNKKDGEETDTDCGGSVCIKDKDGKACAYGYSCKLPRDCISGVCKAGRCQQPTCTDGVKNGDETDIDCGGMCVSCG